MIRQLTPRLRAFGRSRHASVVVETVLIAPLLLLMMVGFHSFWHAIQTANSLQKATFVAADLISREMEPVDTTFLDGLDLVVNYMVRSPDPASLRITSVLRVARGLNTPEGLAVIWSYSPGNRREALTNAALQAMEDDLPLMSPGGTILLVEASLPYRPLANVGLPAMTLTARFAMTPRYVPFLCRAGRPCSLQP